MSQTYAIEGYTFTMTKKNEASFYMTACPEANKSIFQSGVVDLKKIKFETVGVALSNTNPKNINLKINYEQGNNPFNGQLLVSIVVKYEFLPQFSEDIVLKERKLDENDAAKVRLAKLENQIEGISKIMNVLSREGNVKTSTIKSSDMKEQGAEVMSLTKGTYLIQISGLHTSNTAVALEFRINVVGKNTLSCKNYDLAKTTPCFVYTQYSFPFSLSELVELSQDSEIKVWNLNQNNQNSRGYNFTVTARPVIG